jgi:hypothetical protein
VKNPEQSLTVDAGQGTAGQDGVVFGRIRFEHLLLKKVSKRFKKGLKKVKKRLKKNESNMNPPCIDLFEI